MLNMKSELERMEAKQQELKAKKGTLAAQMKQARAGGGAEGLGAKAGGSAFAEFRRMEDGIEARRRRSRPHREIEDALQAAGMSPTELEAKFARARSGQLVLPSGELEQLEQLDPRSATLYRSTC